MMRKIIGIIRNKLKQLYTSGGIHVTIGSFVTKFVAFFGSIFVVRLLSKEDYGLLSYVENIYGYALVIAGLGLSYSILRYVIVAEENKKGSVFKYVVKNSIIINLIISAIIVLANFFAPYPESVKNVIYFVPIIALLVPCQDLFNDGLFTLRATFRNKEYAYWSTAVASILIIGRIVGAIVGNVSGVLWSRVIINTIASIALLLFCKNVIRLQSTNQLTQNEKREIKSYAFQYMITNGLWAVFMLNDLFILGNMISDATVIADYKVAYVLPSNLIIFANAIGIYVGPYFTKNENDLSWVRRNFKKVYMVTFAVVFSVALIIWILANPLIVLLYGESYLNVVPLMRVLLIAAVLNAGLRYTTANSLAAMGQVKYNMVISAIGMALQIILDIVLIRGYKAMGVAISSCIVYAFMSLSLLLVFYKKYYRSDKAIAD